MKSVVKMFALVVMTTLGLASCDPCATVVCNNGSCDEGTCICNTGYMGSDCSTAENSQYTGTYEVTSNCNNAGQGSSASVADAATDPQSIVLRDVMGTVGNDITLRIVGDVISADAQTTGSGTDVMATTFGTVTGSQLDVTLHTATDTCVMTMVKQ